MGPGYRLGNYCYMHGYPTVEVSDIITPLDTCGYFVLLSSYGDLRGFYIDNCPLGPRY